MRGKSLLIVGASLAVIVGLAPGCRPVGRGEQTALAADAEAAAPEVQTVNTAVPVQAALAPENEVPAGGTRAGADAHATVRVPGNGADSKSDAERKKTSLAAANLGARAWLVRPTDFGPLTEALKRKLALAATLDEAALRAELEQRAAAGDAEAALTLGLVLRYGEGAGDKAAGEKFIAAAAETGNARAMAELGRLLLADEGRADGLAQADAWLRKAWAAGESEAAFLLASAQRLGMVEPAEGEVPNELMLAAAELGNAAARRLFMRAEAEGDLEDATPEQVARWSEELAKTGDLEAMELWARHLRTAGEHDAAIEWFRRAAAEGSAQSALALASYGVGDQSVQVGAMNHLRAQIEAGAPESVSARHLLAFLLATQPQTTDVRSEMLRLLREAGARNAYRSSLVADLIEAGAKPREAFFEVRTMGDAEVYRRVTEHQKAKRAGNTELDSAAVLVEVVSPTYPAELRAAQVNGMVTIQYVVNEDGTVGDLTVIASDHPAFSAAALEALARWRFRPRIKDGTPVAARMQIDIPFLMRQ